MPFSLQHNVLHTCSMLSQMNIFFIFFVSQGFGATCEKNIYIVK